LEGHAVLHAARIPAIARDRRFAALWAAHTVSTFGDALTTLTLILLITQRTHSVAAVGGLTIIIAVPGIVIGLFSGAYVDRHDRRRIMIAADLGRGALLVALAVLALGRPTLPALYAIAFLQAAAGTFFNPARAGLMQVVVPAREQVRANSLLQTTTVIGELAGTTLAGVLVAALHTYWLSFALDAATFALSAALITTIRRDPDPPAGQRPTTWTAIVDGLRAVRSSPALRGLLLVFSALTFALSPMAVLLTPYLVDTLHLSTGWLGLIQAGDTAGNIAGGLLVALAATRLTPRTLVTAGTLLLAALITSLAWATTVPALLVAYLAFGLLTVAIQTGIAALTQNAVDNSLMGRFTGLMSIIPGAVSVLAMAFAGTLGSTLGVPATFVLSGAILATSTALAWRQLHHTTRHDAPTPTTDTHPD
jgi:predicted MFS family arabinose efflux permease